MRPFLLPLFLCIHLLTFGKNHSGDSVDVYQLDLYYLTDLVKVKIDSIRISKGLSPLSWDMRLENAARDHAEYLDRRKIISHYQVSMSKKNVLKRAVYYGASKVKMVGENVLWKHLARLKRWDYDAEKYREYFFYTYPQLAQSIVRAWINSPRHFRTLLTPSFDYTGLAIVFDSNKKELVAVQVFADF